MSAAHGGFPGSPGSRWWWSFAADCGTGSWRSVVLMMCLRCAQGDASVMHPPSRRTARPRTGETTSAGTRARSRNDHTDGSAPGAGESSSSTAPATNGETPAVSPARERATAPNTDETHRTTKLKPSAPRTTVTHQQYGGRRPVTVRGRQGPAPPSRRRPPPGCRWRRRDRVRLPKRAPGSVNPLPTPSGVLSTFTKERS